MIAIILALVITVLYLYDFIKVYGVPPSISETFYVETSLKFSITMISCAFLICIGMNTLSQEWYMRLIAFLSSTGLGFVGVSPWFKKHPKIHYIGAIMFLVSTALWSILYSNWWITLIWLLFPILDKKRWIFWVEIYTILMFVIGLILGSI